MMQEKQTEKQPTAAELNTEEVRSPRIKGNIQDVYPLTPMQEGMLYHSLLEPQSTAYFEQMSFHLQGRFEMVKIKEGLRQLIARYDILRTAFINQKAERPVQVVLKERELAFVYHDIRGMSDDGAQAAFIREFKEKDCRNLFNLAKDVLMRLAVIQVGDNEYEFVWSHHHILTDGWCFEILVAEFWELYSSFVENRTPRLQPVMQFRAYVTWLEKQDKGKMKEYWKRSLEDFDGAVTIPKLNDIKVPGYSNGYVSTTLEKDMTARIMDLSSRCQVTANIFLQTVWGIVLGMYNGKQDVVFGSVVSGRPSEIPGVEYMVGLFINAIPVRIQWEEKTHFNELLVRVQREALESEPHHHCPLAEVQSVTNLKQSAIDHLYVFENYPIVNNIEGINARQEEAGDRTRFQVTNTEIVERTHYDFNLIVVPGESIVIKFQFNANLYESSFVERIGNHFLSVMRQVLVDETLTIGQITFLGEEEKRRLLVDFNGPRELFTDGMTIFRLFEEQVRRHPSQIALEAGDRLLTYGELNAQANRLARVLQERGLGVEDVVGVMMEPSFELVTAILAVLKAGGCYMPIDPDYPERRIVAMLADSKATFLLTKENAILPFSITSLKNIHSGNVPAVVTPRREQIKDFDKLPKPDRTLVDYSKYHKYIGIAMTKHTISLQGTRGCPYNCAYCHKIWPKGHVVRTAENIFAEVRQCYDAGVKKFVFIDDIFNLDEKNSSRFFELVLKNKLDARFFFPNGVRTDILKKDFIDLMVAAGTVNMAMALETASPRLQKMIRKNQNLDKFEENVRYLIAKYPHFISEIFMMIGFPSETEEEAMMTINLLESFKWIHFPNLFVLKIFPNSDMFNIALENGVPRELIERSYSLAYHEIPETVPFSKGFVRRLQTRFMNEYFLNKERLLHVLPQQMKIFTEDEMVQKYNSYLPMEIRKLDDVLGLAGISWQELGETRPQPETVNREAFSFSEKIQRYFPKQKKAANPFRVLLLDCSLVITSHKENMLYDMVEAPLGLMYLLTYLNERFGAEIEGKVIKSRIDFDSYKELKTIVTEFKPDLIGIRTLSFFKNFFHTIAFLLRQWGIHVPIIAGGPYATSDYELMLQDPNIDLAVIGEGELIMTEIVEKMMENSRKLPNQEILRGIQGVAFIPQQEKVRLKEAHREIILLDKMQEEFGRYSPDNLDTPVAPENSLYVIYTSGSTGQPKGVMLEHRNLVNLIRFQFAHTAIDFSRVLQFTNITFDVSFQEIFSTLAAGGVLCLTEKIMKTDLPRLFAYIHEKNIRTLFLPASFVKFIFNEDEYSDLFPETIRHIVTAGEQILVTDKFRSYLQKNGVVLHNHYGPTETHVVTTLTLSPERDIPALPTIGKPIANTAIYIVDKQNRLLPIGMPGELMIGGMNVGRGYLGNPEMTATKFRPDPFVDGGRIYATGDLARRRSNGDIEFLGRMDQQVKIRGFRIELGEIESHLLNIDYIKQAVVKDRQESNGQKYLCAYIVADEKINVGELKEILNRRLPDYMVPAYFLQLDKIPVTSHGKIDFRALPDPRSDGRGAIYLRPDNETEAKLVEIWAKSLELEASQIGIKDNFFELGGNSLNILKVVSRINKQFKVNVSVGTIFLRPTIKELAVGLLEDEKLNRLECIVKLNESKSSKKLFILHPLHGMVFQYKELARLLQGQYQVYGVQARGLVRNSYYPETVDLLVADYTRQILEVQKEGPFMIAAYCVGDLYGYYIVHLLEELGHRVEKFIMIDEPNFLPTLALRVHRVKEAALRPIGKLRAIIPGYLYRSKRLRSYERLLAELNTLDNLENSNSSEFIQGEAEQMKAKTKLHQKRLMMDYYRYSPYMRLYGIIHADMINIRAEASNPFNFDAKNLRLMTYGSGNQLLSSGTHHNIFESPQVEKLTELMLKFLNEPATLK